MFVWFFNWSLNILEIPAIFFLSKEEATKRQWVLPFAKEILIEAIRDLPNLWDINHPSYQLRPLNNNAWKKLIVMLGKDNMSKKLVKRHIFLNIVKKYFSCYDRQHILTFL